MAFKPYNPRLVRDWDGPDRPGDQNGRGRVPHDRPARPTNGEPSIGELLRRLSDDTSELVRQEMRLARAELRHTGAALARDGARLGVAAALAFTGVLALGAFAVLALGDLFNNYWLAALLVGVVLLAAGAVLGKNAIGDAKRRAGLPQTTGSLREDAAWARREAHEVRRELTARPRGD
jgi:uncharacterized membrane protein YqjE